MPEIIDAAVITGRVGCCGHVQTMRDGRKLRVKEEDKKGVMGNVYISAKTHHLLRFPESVHVVTGPLR